jgi:hypothetical protein
MLTSFLDSSISISISISIGVGCKRPTAEWYQRRELKHFSVQVSSRTPDRRLSHTTSGVLSFSIPFFTQIENENFRVMDNKQSKADHSVLKAFLYKKATELHPEMTPSERTRLVRQWFKQYKH